MTEEQLTTEVEKTSRLTSTVVKLNVGELVILAALIAERIAAVC